MQRIRFEHQPRPPPIHLAPGTSAAPEYVRTPYPTQSFALESPSSFSTSTIDESRIYYLNQGQPPPGLSDEVSNFFQKWSPLEKVDVNCSCSLLTVTPQWELRLPHPLLHETGAAKFVHAHHVYVQFLPCGPRVEQWESIARDFRDHVLSKYDMQNAAVEFALSGEYGNISAWYPPKLDKEKLVAFFEGDDSHDSDWDLEVEDLEDQSRSLKVSTLGPGRKAELSRKEMALPLLQVNAPEEIDGPRSRARAVGATRSHDREVSPRILVETI